MCDLCIVWLLHSIIEAFPEGSDYMNFFTPVFQLLHTGPDRISPK